MDLAVITAQQVAELFILIGLGALGAKTCLLYTSDAADD